MIPFKKILVPVDFSEPSKKAVTYGLTLAGQFKAKLILAHIVPGGSALPYAFPTDTFGLEKAQEEMARREIQDLVGPEYRGRFDIQTLVKTGTIDEELLGIVKDEAVDLVVIGTHGRRKLSRLFIGSVAEHILRKVPVPVLTVAHVDEKHTIGLVSLQRVLYATDLSESSDTGLKCAIELARTAGAQLTVLHVVYYRDRKLWAPDSIPGFEEEQNTLVQEIRKKIADAVVLDSQQAAQIEALVVEGKPFEKILEVAQERGVDIIVLNLQSKSMVERALIGSTAERVVRLAPIPVLSIPLLLRNSSGM
jgi:nucleotide-binding universal stress UspA family protein